MNFELYKELTINNSDYQSNNCFNYNCTCNYITDDNYQNENSPVK